MPSCSTGFSVAITRKGFGREKVSSPMVTCRSCIASKSALCTLAGARLISSARMMFGENRAFFNNEVAFLLIID